MRHPCSILCSPKSVITDLCLSRLIIKLQPTYTAVGSVKLGHWNGPTSNEIYWRLELESPLSKYTNHKANPGTELFSMFFGDMWREKDCICLDFIFLNLPVSYHMKSSLPKKTVPCAALIRSYNHPKMKKGTEARSLPSHSGRFN